MVGTSISAKRVGGVATAPVASLRNKRRENTSGPLPWDRLLKKPDDLVDAWIEFLHRRVRGGKGPFAENGFVFWSLPQCIFRRTEAQNHLSLLAKNLL